MKSITPSIDDVPDGVHVRRASICFVDPFDNNFILPVKLTETQLGGFSKLVFVGTDGVAVLGRTPYKDERGKEDKWRKQDYMFICYNLRNPNQSSKNPFDRIARPEKDEKSREYSGYQVLSTTSFLAFPEIDGMRMIKRYYKHNFCTCNYLKFAPKEYGEFKGLYNAPVSSAIMERYLNFTEGKLITVFTDSDIREDQPLLRRGINELIICAGFELSESEQSKILKAASWGLTYLKTDAFHNKPNLFYETVIRLKIKHRMNKMGRGVTYDQILHLHQKELIKIFFNAKRYQAAMVTADLLKMPLEIYSRIFHAWATGKISGDRDRPGSEFGDVVGLARAVREKFDLIQTVQGEKLPNTAWTDVGFYVLGMDRVGTETWGLVKELLRYESAKSVKIPMLFEIEEWADALGEALGARDSDLVY